MSAQPKQPPPPPAVTFDPALSTKWTEVYPAESRSQPGQVWRVTFDVRGERWHCPCPDRATCAHIEEARRVQTARWWSAIWREVDDLTLRRDDLRLAALVAAGSATEDDIIAHGALGDEVQARACLQAA